MTELPLQKDGPWQLRRDQLFASGPYPRPFEFNAAVAQVFDDMVLRSIPLYREVLLATQQWSHLYYVPGTRVVDIGCSTGTTLVQLLQSPASIEELVGIDTSEPMIREAQQKCCGVEGGHRLRFEVADALDFDFRNTSVVIINYTLQFIPVAKRSLLLKRIFEGLVPGGLLILSDKVRSASPEFQETVTAIYEHFKLSNGYSRTEIERKKEALENVLVPLTLAEEMQLVHSAGFIDVEPTMKWHNFMTLMARKA